MQEHIFLTPKETEMLIYKTLEKFFNKKIEAESKLEILNLKEVKAIMKIGDERLQDLIASGRLKTTPNKKVTKFELNKCLESEYK